MIMKYAARKLGREIRKATGLKLPVAMRAAKLILRNKSFDLMHTETVKPFVEELPFFCGFDCCGGSGNYKLTGPRGSFAVNRKTV